MIPALLSRIQLMKYLRRFRCACSSKVYAIKFFTAGAYRQRKGEEGFPQRRSGADLAERPGGHQSQPKRGASVGARNTSVYRWISDCAKCRRKNPETTGE